MSALGPLADFIAGPPPSYAAPEVLDRATLAVIDLVAVTLGAALEPVATMLVEYHLEASGAGAASVIGQGARATPVDAAFINGAIGHALDYDDSNFVLGGHPSVTILPGLFALGEARNCSGRDVLEAYIVGFEVMTRIAAAVNFHHYEKGWHPTATLGVFGAAGAASRMLRLDCKRAMNALGLAASCASGIKENFGTMTKPIQVGQAASKGLLMALLAARGATASTTALDGRRGFFELYNGAGEYQASALEIDARQPELMRSGIMFKRYACCGSTHVGIDAALELKARHGFDAADISAIRLNINRRRIPHVDRPGVDEPLEAKFSLQYTLAAALRDGAVGLSQFTAAAIARPDIKALMAKVTVGAVPDATNALGQPCVLEVDLDDGRTLSTRLDGPVGRDIGAYPQYMERKFADCALQVLDEDAAEELFSRLRAFGDQALVSSVMAATSTQPRRASAAAPARTWGP
jgi:2-methylcitrate dehydratase PrpD